MNYKQVLCKLTEGSPCEKVAELLPKTVEISRSPLGNLYGKIPGDSSYTLSLDAHIDQIQMLVTGITPEGFLLTDAYGGVDRRVIPGCEVTVWGRKPLYGVFSITPPHLIKGESGKLPELSSMGIDIGLSYDQATELVRPGDRVTFRPKLEGLQNGRYAGPGLDNLAGVAVLLRVCELVAKADKPLPVSLVVQFSQMEEAGTGFVGGVTGANAWQPAEAIVVDAGFGAYPGSSYPTPGELGKGPMIGISPVLAGEITEKMQKVAKNHQLSFMLDVTGGRTGTNADRITTSGVGIPTGLVSYPLQNMHTPVEMVDETDLEQAAQLLFAYIQEGGLKNE